MKIHLVQLVTLEDGSHVSGLMKPILMETMDEKVLYAYIEKLKMNGWSVIPTEEFVHGHTTVVRKEHGKGI